MSKGGVVGNGKMLIAIDKFGQVNDFYFPYVGHENHSGGNFIHKIGIFVDGRISWVSDLDWETEVVMLADSMTCRASLINKSLNIKIVIDSIVYNEKNVFIREFSVENLSSNKKDLKVFLNQQFVVYQSLGKDTAFFDPYQKAIIHYEGKRMFLTRTLFQNESFAEFSIGLLGSHGKEGTFKDAEDGQLSGNGIEHGTVDSVIGLDISLDPQGKKIFYYWICASKFIKELYEINDYVLKRTPEYLVSTTKAYWNAWINKQNYTFYSLSDNLIELFKKSLFVIRTHVDDEGAIIASCDSELLKHGWDTYSYVWHRDASFTAMALDMAGYSSLTKRFFEFSNDVITEDGYFMHKYRSDRSWGSSWHPWFYKGQIQLPIQEDETAITIFAFWEHYVRTRDIELVEKLYNSLIKRAANFLLTYIDQKIGLPLPSYDLWEEKHGINTFTCCAVYGGLISASKFAKLLGKQTQEIEFSMGAEKIKNAILKELYDEKNNCFYKLIKYEKSKIEIDRTIDMSTAYGLYKFGVLEINDPKLEKEMEIIVDRLVCKSDCGGVARYEGDQYFRSSENIPGNPWIVTTMWLAQYYVEKARNWDELIKAQEYFDWVVQVSKNCGLLPEQVNPVTKENLSATPLIWSHAEYVVTVIKFLEKLENFGVCKINFPLT